jgi:general secretion pathway protein D
MIRLDMKPSFARVNVPSSWLSYSAMALPFPIQKGLFACAALVLLLIGLGIPSFAQDSAPIASGSSNYQKAPVNSILDLYEQLSGKHLIRDANLDGVPPVSMNATGLSKEDTLKLIEATLLLNNVAIIPVDEHSVKVVTIGINKNPRAEGIKLFANAVDLPNDDSIVSYYMPLNYINAQEAAGIFTQVAPVHTYGGYVPAPSAQAVVITENVSVIKQLIALKELIDAPPARVTSEWIQLNRADSDKVADILNKLLGIGANGAPATPAGPGGPVSVPADIGTSEPLSNEKNLISGSAQIISDPRSNRILLVSRPVNIPFLEQMIGQLDQPDIFMVPQRRPLKYVLAQDILPALEAALAQGKDEEDQLKKDQQTATQSAQGRNGQGTQGQAQPTQSASSSSGGTGAVSSVTPQLAQPTENDVPTVVTIGKTRLMADNKSNSIIVFGSPDVVSRVFDMVDQLDRKPLQVYLATVIGQLTVSQGEEFGIDILQKFQKIGQGGLASSNLNSSQVTGTGGGTFVPEPSSLTSVAGFPLPTGLTLYGAIGSTLNAYVRALETTDRFKIISRPSVYTTNNKLAVIASGSQVPVPGTSLSSIVATTGTTADQNAVSTTTVYEDVLLQLDIIPLINANHEVTLQIRQQNNSLGKNVNIGGNLVPIINTQEINTEVTVPNKSTVVIGGLITDNTTRDTSGVPWLSDIPILGYLFKDTTKSKERDELIIMIQPSVVETDADQLAVNEEEKQRTILGREAEQAATGIPGELPQSPTTPIVPVLAPQTDVKSVTVRTPYNSKSGASSTTTTTTTRTMKPTGTVLTPLGPSGPTSPVPALSSPAPDVGNGQMPPYPKPPPAPPTATP